MISGRLKFLPLQTAVLAIGLKVSSLPLQVRIDDCTADEEYNVLKCVRCGHDESLSSQYLSITNSSIFNVNILQ